MKIRFLVFFFLLPIYMGITSRHREEPVRATWRSMFAMNWIATPVSAAPQQARNDNIHLAMTSVPILHQGRIKPLDSYARAILLRFSGKSTYERKPAIDWLARALFEPETTFSDKIFLINNPEVLEAIGVKPDSHRRYSFDDLRSGASKLQDYAAQALNKEEKNRSEIEKEFIRVFLNLYNYLGIVDSLKFYEEHPDFNIQNPKLMQRLGLQIKNSLFDLMGHTEKLSEKIFEDKETLAIAFNLFSWIENHRIYKDFLKEEEALVIIYDDSRQVWLDPWDALLTKGTKYNQELFALQEIYQAYKANDQKAFDTAINKFQNLNQSKNPNYSTTKISLELLYNQINPFLWAKILYGLTFILIWIGLLRHSVPCNDAFLRGSWGLLSFGALLHLYGIVSRVLILSRPPVSNLYETFIFISFLMVLIGILINIFDKKSSIGVLLASFAGLILLLISGKFAAEGDTMQVLIAVLNSNFWLSTHVICVSIGYAAVAFAGLIGHVYLLQKIFRQGDLVLEKTFRLIYAVIGFGLAFSFLGTMLGGVWADQSWGRFWGWDPKENGALIIVLWCAMLFHARMAGLVKHLGFALGAALGTMVVMTSWLGINLLGVGLHSYGFTSGLAKGLYTYYACEIFFITSCLLIISKMKTKIRYNKKR